MSILNYKYCDEILLHYCSTDIDLCNILKHLNKYYYGLINDNNIYKSWVSLLDHNKDHCIHSNFQNNLFMNVCKKGNIIICNYIINKFNGINIHEEDEHAFRASCGYGQLEIAQWLIDLGMQKNFTPIDIHAKCEVAFQRTWKNIRYKSTFQWSCTNGQLEIAKWLVDLSMQKNFTPIDIHAHNEYAFRVSCYHGQLEIAKWLVNLGMQKNFTPINIHANNEYAFHYSHKNGHLNVTHWLHSLDKSIKVII